MVWRFSLGLSMMTLCLNLSFASSLNHMEACAAGTPSSRSQSVHASSWGGNGLSVVPPSMWFSTHLFQSSVLQPMAYELADSTSVTMTDARDATTVLVIIE